MSKTFHTFNSNVQPKRKVRPEPRAWVCDVCTRHVAKHWPVCPFCNEGERD